MKRIALLGVCLLVSAAATFAQFSESYKVNLPVAAAISDVVLPSGEYTIRSISHDNSSPILEIRAANGASYLVLASPISTPGSERHDRTELTLKLVGDRYQLEKLWVAGSSVGYEILSAR